jgi:hypothetical protein
MSIPFIVVSDPPDQRGWVDALLVQGDLPTRLDRLASVEVETDRLFEANDPRADALLQLLQQKPYVVVSCETPELDTPLLQMHYPPWRASHAWHCLRELLDLLGVDDWKAYDMFDTNDAEREVHTHNAEGEHTTVLRALITRASAVSRSVLRVVLAYYIDTRVQVLQLTEESRELGVVFTPLRSTNYVSTTAIFGAPPEETDVPTD